MRIVCAVLISFVVIIGLSFAREIDKDSTSQLNLVTTQALADYNGCSEEMVGYWKLDEQMGGLYSDSCSDNDGFCDGNCPDPCEDGKVGVAQCFDGAATGIDVVDDNDVFDFDSVDDWTVEFWMKKDVPVGNGGTNDNEVIIGRNSDTVHWWLGVENTSGAIRFQLPLDAGGYYSINGPVVDNGKWHHIVAIREGSADSMRLYVDGVDVNDSLSVGAKSFTSAENLNIGWLDLSGGYHYEGLLDEVAIYDRVISEQEILSHYYLARDYCQGYQEPVKIMPLGDSITYDNHSGDTRLDPNERHSYRNYLWYELVDCNYNVDFVGSRQAGQDIQPPFDVDNEGWSGWTDDQIAENIYNDRSDSNSGYNWLSQNPADVILLHIGTNSLEASAEDVNDILKEIDQWEADNDQDVTVILAKIINRQDEGCGVGTTHTFNNNIQAIADDRIAAGDKIIVVDMECGAGIDYNNISSGGDMIDSLHPANSGYEKMAYLWFDALQTFLPICGPYPPLITSQPITEAYVDTPYSYAVEADGVPEPNFYLVDAPNDMDINTVTGLISWTPAVVGDFNVVVEANNSQGYDWQSFVISVDEQPICPEGIISYWKLDETGSPSSFSDSVGTNDGACAGGGCPIPATGQVGGCMSNSGSSGMGINIPADESFDWAADDSFSIEYWMKQDGVPTENDVIVARDDSATTLHWWLGVQKNTGYPAFQLISSDGDGQFVNGTVNLSDDDWHHCVFVRDAAIGYNRIFIDGVEDMNVAKASYSSGFDSATAPMTIGWITLDTKYTYTGMVDEVAIYGRALSASEILGHYVDGLAGNGYCNESPCEPNIISTPLTEAVVGVGYNYDVDATGSPAPTYSLIEAPNDMDINSVTGLINWVPFVAGDFNVTVEANNSEGYDWQSFVVSVNEAPPFALKINCGGSAVVDGEITWQSSAAYVTDGSDYTFSTSSVDTTTNSIEEPVPPLDVYKACRHQSPHTYSFAQVPDGDYVVRIHWIDQVTSSGLREIDYDIEGVRVLEDWDIYAEAGGQYVAIDKEFFVSVSDGNGMQIVSSAASGDAFESAIEITSLEPASPNIISTPVTDTIMDELYEYDVDATGYPIPSYSLIGAPNDMDINSVTGVINWIPSVVGDFNVVVEADNVEGFDTQSFVITVTAPDVCPDDMISYWKMDDESVPDIVDSFNDHDGTCSSGCPEPNENGIVNGALYFDGGDEVQVADHDDFDWSSSDSFSIEIWLNTTQDLTGNKVFVGKYKGGSDMSWWLGGGDDVNDNIAILSVRDSLGNSQSIYGEKPLSDGQWHHIVGVRDADVDTLSLYVDGIGKSVSKSYSGDFVGTDPIYIGYYIGSYHFRGLLDEVAIYKRALTVQEVMEHWNSGTGRNYCSGDSDGDGIGDDNDNCPSTYNPDQNDIDLDDVGDLCDNCPNSSNFDQTDSDDDGIGNVCDNCPEQANPDQNDLDLDGVGTACDNCPQTGNSDQGDLDEDGIGDSCECYRANIDEVNPVGFRDFAKLAMNWLKDESEGDTNWDSIVDNADLSQVAQHWLEDCSY